MDTFKAITWNVYAGTPAEKLAPHLKRELKRGVSLLLMQEAGGKDIEELLVSEGLSTTAWDGKREQWRIAWDPEEWPGVARSEIVQLSDTGYQRKGGGPKQYSKAARVILCDDLGRSLEAFSYHTPAHIQVAEDERPANRFKATIESFETLGEMAAESLATGWLAGGDDNVDEFRGIGSESNLWNPMLAKQNGLVQVRAPEPTFARRRIDDFRYPKGGGIKVIRGEGWVANGGATEKPAHKIHGQVFKWVHR